MIEAINTILQGAGLGSVHSASVQIVRSELDTPQDVLGAVNNFTWAEGWLCLTDEVLVVKQGTQLPSLNGRIILSGELALGAKSIHIRQNGAGWEQYTLERSNGGDQLMVEESFQSIPKADGITLKYETFWQTDSNGALAPFASRFAGFGQGGTR